MDTAQQTIAPLASGLRANILAIEDDPGFRTLYRDLLLPAGHHLTVAESPFELPAGYGDAAPDIVLLDLFFQAANGLDAIPDLLSRWPSARIMVISAADEGAMAVEAIRRGAYDFLSKDERDFAARLLLRIRQTLETIHLERKIALDIDARGGYAVGDDLLVGTNRAMREIYRLIDKVALGGVNALISGESGTGKELVARAIHLAGGRRALPFVSIDCGAMAGGVLESELFGVARDYPGFHNRERLVGRLAAVGDGVLLLDEIGNMDVDLQAKLLRVLEEKEFHPIGEAKTRRLGAQILASTNVDLPRAIATGRFREDLFFRLNEVRIAMPPLRERMEDVPLLVTRFVSEHNTRTREDRRVTPDALEKLMDHRWPGNVRELKKTVERALILTDCRFITAADIQITPRAAPAEPSSTRPTSMLPSSPSLPLKEAEDAFRKAYVEDVIRKVDGDKQRAAVLLGVDLRTIQRILNSK
jgi:DNA-binding NtrC family response regulator